MNDAAYLFKQTNRERSVTARGARHKRNGSRSKKCTLPSDNLTPAQKKGLNGTVETYSMNAPHTLEELKLWPEDLRHEYMEKILATYRPKNQDLARMLGCPNTSVPRLLPDKFKIFRDRGWRPTNAPERHAAWNQFLGIEETPVEQPRVPILDEVEFRFTGKVQDLIDLIQMSMLGKSDARFTFSLHAERRD